MRGNPGEPIDRWRGDIGRRMVGADLLERRLAEPAGEHASDEPPPGEPIEVGCYERADVAALCQGAILR